MRFNFQSLTKSVRPNIILLFALLLLHYSCKDGYEHTSSNTDSYSYNLGVIGGFSELVSAGVKDLALSAALSPEEMDKIIDEAERIAKQNGASIYRESDLLITDLFPPDIAGGKDVLLIYKGTTLDRYLKIKSDRNRLVEENTYSTKERIDISRRFGRLLSYSPRKINNLLAQNTTFRTMHDFGIMANNIFLYYNNLEAAGEFYTQTLGLELIADYEMALILRMSSDSYLILVDADEGMHSADEPKSVALALLTDQLDEWWEYLQAKNIEVKYSYKPKEGSAHDGFVIVDPEGYLLEFERFNQHRENELFVPLLERNISNQVNRPEKPGIHSTITWLYYKDVLAMQNFYEDILGLEIVADQGWTKIYQVSETAFLGIVDERRGMNKANDQKAVNVGFIIKDLEPWFEYVLENEPFKLRGDELGIDEDGRYKAFVGYGPEGYYLEFDKFYQHAENQKLMELLDSAKK